MPITSARTTCRCANADQDAAASGHTLPAGPIFLLTHLRYLGYCFNPVSFFYLRPSRCAATRARRSEQHVWRVASLLAQAGTHEWVRLAVVNHQVVLRVAVHAGRRALQLRVWCTARSPRRPHDAGRPGRRGTRHALDATLSLEHHPWTHAAISRALVRHPAMTLSVIAGIHWEAVRLWWKGLPLVPVPLQPGRA